VRAIFDDRLLGCFKSVNEEMRHTRMLRTPGGGYALLRERVIAGVGVPRDRG
jgi:hypothetical protein